MNYMTGGKGPKKPRKGDEPPDPAYPYIPYVTEDFIFPWAWHDELKLEATEEGISKETAEEFFRLNRTGKLPSWCVEVAPLPELRRLVGL